MTCSVPLLGSSDKISYFHVPVNVPVQTVIVRNELVLPLIVELALEVHVLQDGQVRLVAGKRDRGHVHQALGAVVVEHLKHDDEITDGMIETSAIISVNTGIGPTVFGSERRNTTIGLKILLF